MRERKQNKKGNWKQTPCKHWTSLLREQRDYNCFFQTATKKVCSKFLYLPNKTENQLWKKKKSGVLYMSNLCRNRFTLKQTINGLIVVRTATEKKMHRYVVLFGFVFWFVLLFFFFFILSFRSTVQEACFVFFVLIISQICQRFCFLSQVLVEFVFL